MKKIEFVDDVMEIPIGNILSLIQWMNDLFVLTDNGIWVISEKNKQSAIEKFNKMFFTKKYETK